MKKLLSALIMLALIGTAGASIPDPDYSEVLPQDNMDLPRLVGIPSTGAGSFYADIDVYVRAYGGIDLFNVYVEIVLAGHCSGSLCLCNDLVLTGYTAANGHVDFNTKLGGCCEGAGSAIILADGISLRGYDYVVSPDWDGVTGNCATNLPDFTFFSAALAAGATGCTDYNGDDVTGLPDFAIFGSAWARTCTP